MRPVRLALATNQKAMRVQRERQEARLLGSWLGSNDGVEKSFSHDAGSEPGLQAMVISGKEDAHGPLPLSRRHRQVSISGYRCRLVDTSSHLCLPGGCQGWISFGDGQIHAGIMTCHCWTLAGLTHSLVFSRTFSPTKRSPRFAAGACPAGGVWLGAVPQFNGGRWSRAG